MWPFKKRSRATEQDQVEPTAAFLNHAEREWLEAQRGGFRALLDAADLQDPGEEAERRLAACDELIRWWRRCPPTTRPDPNHVVNAVGVSMGDVLASQLGLDWRIITDAFGTDLGLWADSKGEYASIILSPTHTVAKRFCDESDGFVAVVAKAIAVDVRRMQRGEHPS